MKSLLIFVVAILFFLPVLGAQDREEVKGFTIGYAYNQGSDLPNQAWGTFDRQISGPLFSYSGTDIAPYRVMVENKAVLKFRIQAFTGLSYRIHDFGIFSLWTSGAGGVASVGETTTGLAKYAGFAHVPIKSGFGVVVGGEGTYSPLAGSDGIFRVGLRYGVK